MKTNQARAEHCDWTESIDGLWEGTCGSAWNFRVGGPVENKVNFCPHCGRPVHVIAYADECDACDQVATHYDAEGVPLCDEHWKTLLQAAADDAVDEYGDD